MTNSQLLQVILRECRTHAEVLAEASDELAGVRFDPDTVTQIAVDQRRLLDQMAYRFSKLQDSMGMKLLPLLLDLAEEPLPDNVTFAVKLQRLERLGALENVEQWRLLREIRNQLAHEYEDAPALKAAALNRFVDAIKLLIALWKHAEKFSSAF